MHIAAVLKQEGMPAEYIDRITIHNNKLTKPINVLLNGDINGAGYKDIKSENEHKIILLEARLSEIGTELIKVQDLEPIVNDAISTLTKIDVYSKSEPDIQRKIVGSMFPKTDF
jgi:site-specific DNA recombinase